MRRTLNRISSIGMVGTVVAFAGVGSAVLEPATAAASYPTLSIAAGKVGRGGAPTPGPVAKSRLGSPLDVAVAADGTTYVLDIGPNDGTSHGGLIEKITTKGVLSVIAGNGRSGAPKAGKATRSPLDPRAVAVDAKSNVFVVVSRSESASQVVKVTPAGILSIVAGNGRGGPPKAGPAKKSPLAPIFGIDVDAAGTIYLAGAGHDFGGTSQVLRVTSKGVLSVLAGSGKTARPRPGKATRSPLGNLQGIAVDGKRNVFVADGGQDGVNDNGVVEKISPQGTLSIVAGKLGASGTPKAGKATASPLHYPLDVDVDAKGSLYIADGDLAYGGNCDVLRVTAKGALSVVAGRPGHCDAPVPGRATKSPLNPPGGVAVGPKGTLLVADPFNSVVERIRGL